jgi:hypothetical protein
MTSFLGEQDGAGTWERGRSKRTQCAADERRRRPHEEVRDSVPPGGLSVLDAVIPVTASSIIAPGTMAALAVAAAEFITAWL